MNLPDIMRCVPGLEDFIGKRKTLRLVSRACRDVQDFLCQNVALKCEELLSYTDGNPIAAGLVASKAYRDMAARGCRPATLRVAICAHACEKIL